MDDPTVAAYGCQRTTKDNVWHGRGKCCGIWPLAFPRSHYSDVLKLKSNKVLHASEETVIQINLLYVMLFFAKLIFYIIYKD